MKKILCLLICLLAVLAMTGCNLFSDAQETTVPTQTLSTDATDQEPTDILTNIPYEDPLVAVAVPHIDEYFLAEDNTCIFTYTNQDMLLTMDDATVADMITADFLSRNDFSAAAQEVLDAAKAAYAGQQDWTPYFYELFYSPVRLDQQVLSLFGSEIIYNGTPRSVTANVSVTYDLLTGKALTLQDVLQPNYTTEDLVGLIVNSLHEYSEQGILFTDYEYIISDLFSTNTPMERWYLSDKGLCFYFTPYEIAPYTAGAVIAELPYTSLTSLLKNDYFPPETDTYAGTVSIIPTGDAIMDAYEFTEVILDTQGIEYLITTQGTALNVRLHVGSWADDYVSFQSRYVVYAATAITEGQALLLQVAFNDLQSLGISYNDIFNEPLNPYVYGAPQQ